MINANKQIVALALGLSVALVASQASAQNMTKRDAAIAACIQQAQTQYPSDYAGSVKRDLAPRYTKPA